MQRLIDFLAIAGITFVILMLGALLLLLISAGCAAESHVHEVAPVHAPAALGSGSPLGREVFERAHSHPHSP